MAGVDISAWMAPPIDPRVEDGAVHLWRCSLRRAMPKDLEAVLAWDELARAGRFKLERDRKSFLLSAYAVRRILSIYLGVPGGLVPIAVSAKGKPYLKGDIGGEALHFNLSHHSGVVMVAVAKARVGVDVEGVDEVFPCDEVGRGFFAPGEAGSIQREPGGRHKARLFFGYWTKKEALLKAAGEGLYEDLSRVDFSGGGEAVDYGGSRWTVVEMELEGRVLCSLALEWELKKVQRFVWEP